MVTQHAFPQSSRRIAGSALVELLFATVILAIGALALGSTMVHGHSLAESTRQEYAARDAIRRVMTDVLATPFPEVAGAFNRTGFAVAGIEPAKGDADGLPGEIAFEYGPDSNTYYKVTATVRWSGKSGNRVVSVVQYVANIRGDPGVPPPLRGTPVDQTIEPVIQPVSTFASIAAAPPVVGKVK